MTGSIRSLRFEEHEEDVSVNFVFDSGSRRFVGFTVGREAIPRADIENLLTDKHRSRVTACLNGGKWIAEEIIKEERSK